MHAFRSAEGTMFNYNTDFSGNVTIWRANKEIDIPAGDLLEFIAQTYVAARRVERIESMSTEQLLADFA